MPKFPQPTLEKILESLSHELYEDLTSYIEKFQLIYPTDESRHSYSSITALILKLRNENKEALSNICQNLLSIIDMIEDMPNSEQKSVLIKKINKLFDHVSLEQIRIEVVYKVNEEKAEKAKESYTQALRKLEETNSILTEVDKLVEDSKNIKVEVVTVLSIFAAIIMASVGGLSFSNTTLQVANQGSIFRISFLLIICGIVILNTIFGLMYIVSKIINRPIYTKCKTPDCSCAPQCKPLERLKNRLPYIYYLNLCMLVLLILVLLGWFFDVKSLAAWYQSAKLVYTQ